MMFWIDGPYGPAFLRNRAVDPNEKLSVWNLKNIRDDDTRSVVLALLSGIISHSIESGPTVVVMDEVWSILKGDAGPDLVESLYRTVRKEGSAIWSISQSMSDYAALPVGCRDAILNNSQFKVLLAHEAANIETAAAICRLNEREASLLQSLRTVPGQYSEILCMLSQRRQVLRLVPTPIEYWIATSHKKDVDWEALALSASPNRSRFDVLKGLARRYPNGALHLVREEAA